MTLPDKRTTGKWLIGVHKHLEEFSASPELTYFDATTRAAQCGRFLALIRKKEIIRSEAELIAIARSIRIPPTDLKRILLPELQDRGLITFETASDGSIKEVREFAPSEQEILDETAQIWESLTPQNEERIAIYTLETCSVLPLSHSDWEARLMNMGFRHEEIDTSFSLQRAFQIIKAENFQGERELTLYNEYIFRENVEQVVKYLRRLDPSERDNLEQMIRQIRLQQGVPIQDIAGIPEQMLHAARTTGMLDVTRIRTIEGDEKLFAFTPHFHTFGAKQADLISDTWDEVKLFVAHIRYGTRFAKGGTGRINDPIVLVDRLLRNREIGPATAIGRDYPLLETHGIIRTRRSTNYPNRHYMELVKDDVVEKALKVLEYGDEGSIDSSFSQNESGLYVPGYFMTPEQDRLRLTASLGRQADKVKVVEQQLLRAWRGEDF